jgi:hypothetical protein
MLEYTIPIACLGGLWYEWDRFWKTFGYDELFKGSMFYVFILSVLLSLIINPNYGKSIKNTV